MREQVVEVTAEAQAAAREARMFEVAMNLAKTEAKSAVAAAEQLRRDAEAMQSALNEKDTLVNALRVEVAALKASFKQIAPVDDTVSAERADIQQQQQKQQREPWTRVPQHRASPPQPRFALADSEHWQPGTTIALASLPSPSPRKPEVGSVYAANTNDAALLPPARAFGTVVDANVGKKGSAMSKNLPKQQQQQQQQQQQLGAWPLQQRHLQDGGRLEHVVTWTSGGYSDNAAKKARQQQGNSSRGKLVFLR
jgi:hypothetical protein